MNIGRCKRRKYAYWAALLSILIFGLNRVTWAERLPIKAYTTVDGLACNNINKIVRDSRGFIWFCTADGLSRFDGYSFTNLGTDLGLPHSEVMDLLETREGEYWVATKGGLVRFNPKSPPEHRVIYENEPRPAKPMFTVVLSLDGDAFSSAITTLVQNHFGEIWCGTRNGLYRLDVQDGKFSLRPIDIGLPPDWGEGRNITDLLEGCDGSLWVAAPSGLYRRWPDGSSAHYTKKDGLPDNYLHDLLEDHDGQLWAGTRYGGFFRFVPDQTHKPPVIAASYATREGMTTPWVFQLFEASDHSFWVATARGLLQFFPNRDLHGRWFHCYSERNGLSYYDITALSEDLGGSLWLGTNTAGAMKLERHGFTTYDQHDGLTTVSSILQDGTGAVCFRGSVFGDEHKSFFEGAKQDPIGRKPDYHHTRLGKFDGRRFTCFMPNGVSDLGWKGEGVTLRTRNGEWWIGSASGLYRFPPTDNFEQIKTARPIAVYSAKDGLGTNDPYRLFEDSHGNVWISNMSSRFLSLWMRETESIRDVSSSLDIPPDDRLPRSFGEDRFRNVWIGFNGRLVRYHDGKFNVLTESDGIPPGVITSVYSDRVGRLWLASARSGLIRVDHPEAQQPEFVPYSIEQGLSSNSTEILSEQLIVEDLQGHIYIGTGRGLDRLDPITGQFKHFTTADGLAPGSFRTCFRDNSGGLWFGLTGGLSHLVPAAEERVELPPPILISGVQVAGARRFISALGETEIVVADLPADQNDVQIDFTGLSFAPGEKLYYQYLLEGAESGWGSPTEQRSVNYRLSPGRYRFLVRAVNSDGVFSATPAMLAFRILPPFWQRWWFVSICAVALTLVLYTLYRYRIARLVELERVRTRIASDLHDDIGANLSLIAGMSDVLRQQAPLEEPSISERLALIATVSRRSVDAMSDIVWAVNPNRDHLSDLTGRMRRFANETLGARGIQFRFESPGFDDDTKIASDVRRELFLIFKEAMNNIARHSECRLAEISLRSEGGQAYLKVSDDGRGFDVDHAECGQGLASIRKRANNIGAELLLVSSPGQGATILVKAPLK
ncbi:MAG TPA: two-component regulator propeller domain-containing protein [Blastocatellia bacterium]|nr:two-component regulator propeller domain-containing protein [Blastocatellia bacterium]